MSVANRVISVELKSELLKPIRLDQIASEGRTIARRQRIREKLLEPQDLLALLRGSHLHLLAKLVRLRCLHSCLVELPLRSVVMFPLLLLCLLGQLGLVLLVILLEELLLLLFYPC